MGKRGRAGATVAAAPTLIQAAAAGVAPTGVRGGAGGEGEGGAPRAGGAVRGADAHGPPAPSLRGPEAWAGHHLPAGDGVREGKVGAPGWAGGDRRAGQQPVQRRIAERGRAGSAEQRSSGGAPRPAGGRAREWEPAKRTGRSGTGQGYGARRKQQEQAQWTGCTRDRSGARGAPGKGTREGRTEGNRQQGARESRASGQRAGEDRWPWVYGVTHIPREGNGMVGGCRPACHPTVSATTLPCGRDGVPIPNGVPGCAIASVHAVAPASRRRGVGSTGMEGRGAQEGMGEDSGGRKEAGGEGSTDNGRSHGEGRRRQLSSCTERGHIFREGWRGSRGQSGKARGPGSRHRRGGVGRSPPTTAI